MDFVNSLVAGLEQARRLGIEVVVYRVEGYYDCDAVVYIGVRGECGSQSFGEHPDVCEYTRYRFLVSFWLGDFRVVEQFLEDRVYYSLADMRADRLKFRPHGLGAVDIDDIIEKVVAHAFSDDAAVMVPQSTGILLVGSRSRVDYDRSQTSFSISMDFVRLAHHAQFL